MLELSVFRCRGGATTVLLFHARRQGGSSLEPSCRMDELMDHVFNDLEIVAMRNYSWSPSNSWQHLRPLMRTLVREEKEETPCVEPRCASSVPVRSHHRVMAVNHQTPRRDGDVTAVE